MKLVLFGNTFQTKKSIHIQKLLNVLHSLNVELYVDASFYQFVKQELNIAFTPTGIFEGNQFEADLAISMGGDGTFLKAASRIGKKNIPIIGINTGRLGFLADISPEEIENTFTRIMQGDYKTEERKVLQIECEGQELKGYPYALNEVAVLKRDSSSMISIHTTVNGEFLNTYQADGLLVKKKKGKSAGSTAAQNKITPSFTDERYLSGFIRTAHINKSIISAAIFFECFTLIYTLILYQKLLHENRIEVFFFFGQDEIYVVDFVFKFDCGFHAFGRT